MSKTRCYSRNTVNFLNSNVWYWLGDEATAGTRPFAVVHRPGTRGSSPCQRHAVHRTGRIARATSCDARRHAPRLSRLAHVYPCMRGARAQRWMLLAPVSCDARAHGPRLSRLRCTGTRTRWALSAAVASHLAGSGGINFGCSGGGGGGDSADRAQSQPWIRGTRPQLLMYGPKKLKTCQAQPWIRGTRPAANRRGRLVRHGRRGR